MMKSIHGKHISYFKGREIEWKMKEYGMKSNDNIVVTSSGGVKRAKMNEIYDIVGNLFEYVNSRYIDAENNALVRGGSAGYNGTIENTNYPSTSYSDWGMDGIHYIIGFRVTLFIK